VISTATGVGAALSQLISGLIVRYAGFNAAFLVLAGVASIALACFRIAMPETREVRRPSGYALLTMPSLR